MNKINIVFCCAGGFSTSCLIGPVTEAGAKRGIEVNASAIATTNVTEHVLTTDIFMLAPQVRYMLSELAELTSPVPAVLVPMQDFGMRNGENILNQALAALEQG